MKYLIKDDKNTQAYYSLLFGLIHNDLSAVQVGIKGKAAPSKLFIEKDYDKHDDSLTLMDTESPLDFFDSALEFSEHCSPKIFEYLATLGPMTKNQKINIVLKTINAKTETSETERIIKEYVTSKNINERFVVYSLRNPIYNPENPYNNTKASFLHLACYTKNLTAVKILLEMGANPNLKMEMHDQKDYTPGHIAVWGAPDKGSQKDSVSILKMLLDNKANFSLKIAKETVWSAAISKFKLPELKIMFATHQPKDLESISEIRQKSVSLYNFWQKSSTYAFKSYPLINDIFKYENLKINIKEDTDFSGTSSFLKHKSLKDALLKRYNLSSRRFTSHISSKMFERKDGAVTIHPEVLKKADFLKKIYLEQEVPNTSDFLDCLEADSETLYDLSKNELSGWNIKEKDVVDFIKSFHTHQIKELLNYNEPENGGVYIVDTISMRNRFSKEIDLALKSVPFSEINNFQKLHDFISMEIETLEQENYRLEQEKNFPSLLKLNTIALPAPYGLKVAEESHELIRWGSMMGHCVGGGDYAEAARDGDSILMALTYEGIPKYCIEIMKSGIVNQVQGKSHTIPPKEILKELFKGLKDLKLTKKLEKVDPWY